MYRRKKLWVVQYKKITSIQRMRLKGYKLKSTISKRFSAVKSFPQPKSPFKCKSLKICKSSSLSISSTNLMRSKRKSLLNISTMYMFIKFTLKRLKTSLRRKSWKSFARGC